tara:strand:+ start:438 stop:680 length:243 start_codon:yes stop_codon:yes gene_type:complete
MYKALTLIAGLTLLSTGCSTQREVVYKRISFADTNGVTTIYYPLSMEEDMIHPHDDERWKYVASKNANDDGKAKLMIVKP